MGCSGMNLVDLDWDRDQWRGLMASIKCCETEYELN
jgi:hypothetical protein